MSIRPMLFSRCDARGRLVHQEHRGLQRQRQRDIDQLALPLGQLERLPVGERADTDEVEQVLDLLAYRQVQQMTESRRRAGLCRCRDLMFSITV